MKAKDLDKKFDAREDITKFLDFSKATRPRDDEAILPPLMAMQYCWSSRDGEMIRRLVVPRACDDRTANENFGECVVGKEGCYYLPYGVATTTRDCADAAKGAEPPLELLVCRRNLDEIIPW